VCVCVCVCVWTSILFWPNLCYLYTPSDKITTIGIYMCIKYRDWQKEKIMWMSSLPSAGRWWMAVCSTPCGRVTVTGLRCPVATMWQCHNGQFVGEKSAPRDLVTASHYSSSLAMVTTVTSRLNGCPEHEHCMIFKDFICSFFASHKLC